MAAPQPVQLTVCSGTSTLELPVRPPETTDASLPPFGPPEMAPGSSHTPLHALPLKRVVERDLTTDEVVYTLSSDGGEFGGHSLARIEEINMEIGYQLMKRHRVRETEPLTAKTEIVQHVEMRREDWSVHVDTTVRVASAADHFEVTTELDAYENGKPVRTKRWNEKVARKLL